MARRLVAISATIALIRLATIVAPAIGAQPNIVVITTDDAGYNDFGFMASLNGEPTDVRTPNLDALANRSMLMSSGYACGPICSPSRAALLTGQYSQRLGYEDNPGHSDGFEANQQLISHQLKNLGYTTGAVGKWHMGETDGINRPLDLGFDEFFGFLWGGRPFFKGAADTGRAMRRGDTNIESLWTQEGDTSRYDPVRGRYATDAFGEESADFINRHANDENPFFLYVALHGPHVPLDAKQSDLDQFADIADPNRRKIAAMTYAVDRAVGDITSALAANGLDENTIIVFTNDNGGPSTAPYDNGPLRGNKGSLWEGGIRVPFMIKAPGLAGGVYDEAVAAIDLLPTLVNAAGGDAAQIDTDGTDLMPFLTGDIAGDPHELMFWRSAGGRYAVRKGDWKLVRPGTATFARLQNLADDVHEDYYHNAQHPELVEELHRELTFWEATLEKPKWGVFGNARNRFNHFVFRNDLATASNWSTIGNWKAAGTNSAVRFLAEDSYANAVLEFGVRNDVDYTSTNDLRRSTNQTFMLNQVRFTGSFSGTVDRSGTINGNALLFVKNLAGELPRIQLDATASTQGSQVRRFTHRFDNDIQLLDDLEITGDGTQQFIINSNISDYFDPRRVIKSGASTVILNGNNTFAGGLTINGGRVITSNIAGSVEVNGGRFSPGPSRASAKIGGDFVQSSGVIEIELGVAAGGIQYDSMVIDGSLRLGGTLQVSLVDGFMPQPNQSFTIFDVAGSLNGAFSAIDLPTLTTPLTWNTSKLYSRGLLSVTYSELPGDLNRDSSSDAADFVVWSKWQSQFNAWQASFGELTVGGNAAADLNRDNIVDAADYVMWRKLSPSKEGLQTHFGGSIPIEGIDGDYNGDGTVDAADYVMWRKTGGTALDYKAWRRNFTQTDSLPQVPTGDFNGDYVVNAADYVMWRKTSGSTLDYNAWRTYFGQIVDSGSSQTDVFGTVPEPSSLITQITGSLMLLVTCRLRHRRDAAL